MKDDYVASCHYDFEDTVTLRVSGDEVLLLPDAGSLYLTPKKAKKLAKALKAAAKQAKANREDY